MHDDTFPAGLVIPQVSELLLLNVLVAAEWDGSRWYLFDGSVTPGLGDTTATYLTHQVTWPGILNPTGVMFGSASIGSDSHAVAVAPEIGWEFNAAAGDKTIGGTFALDVAGNLLGAQIVLTGPVVLTTTGQVLPFVPQVSLSSLYL
jgi:hypothetical protein